MVSDASPSDLPRRGSSRSFSSSSHAVAYTCLVAAVLMTAAFQSDRPESVLWPAMIVVLPMVLLLYLSSRSRAAAHSIAYLVVGGACTFGFVLTFFWQHPDILGNDAFSLALPKIALVMVGGPARTPAGRLAWCAAGYVVAELFAGAAILVSGHALAFDTTTFVAFLATVIVVALSAMSKRVARRTQPMLHRAAREEQLAAMRYRTELKATSLMHDTVLSHLAAIAASTGQTIAPDLRRQIERDLRTLLGDEWLMDDSADVESQALPEWKDSSLFAAIEESRRLGLRVESTGDHGAVAHLDSVRSASLGLAVKQCLVNVLRHSGTTQAEVAVFGSGREISVMVIDAGRGFSEAEIGSDRLGLKQSVRGRVEEVGGTVQVWSTPGRGTSIMIRLPISLADATTTTVEPS